MKALAPWDPGELPEDFDEASPFDDEPSGFPEPEDRGSAVLSELGDVEYVEDLIRPGRIVVVAAEEGAGKSYSIDDELAIRVAVAGGSFAETWPVLENGPVLVLSEMHPDDDFGRESTVLASLGLERPALVGRYFRLSLMTAAHGQPALSVPEWRQWVTAWMRDHRVLLAIFNTATGATQVDPWGKAIQEVFANLRVMTTEYPELAVLLLLHLKKPSSRGDRRLSDVLGEWGRWCDVVVLMESDGASLERTKLTVRKRVRRERRIVATKRGGLLIEATEPTTGGTKVAKDLIASTFLSRDTWTAKEFAAALGVTKPTATKYLDGLDCADSATVDDTRTWFPKETR